MKTIALTASTARDLSYGIVLVSESVHTVSGKGVHNRSFNHQVDVWENKGGTDPNGRPTTDTHTFILKARATVISASPQEALVYGEALAIGDEVTLTIAGLPVGTFVVTAQPLADPHLVRI